MIRIPLPRPCKRCGKRIKSPTKAQKICESCCNQVIKDRIFRNKRQYIKICKVCNSKYQSPFKFSKLCPNCDKSKTAHVRNRYKKILINKK